MDEPICTYGGGQYGEPDPPYGECLDESGPTPPSPTILRILTVQLIADDEVRIKFSIPMSLDGLTNVANYVFAPVVQVNEVLVPTALGSINYVDLHVTGLASGVQYTLSLNNIVDVNESGVTAELVFTPGDTKSTKLMGGLPRMYTSDIKSLMRHLLVAVGIEDEIIGGGDQVSRTIFSRTR